MTEGVWTDNNWTDAPQAVRDAMRENWQQIHGLRPAGGSTAYCICRLLGRRHGRYGCVVPAPPGCDHPSLWLRDGKPVVFVFQPYGLTHAQLVSLVAYAEELGLHLRIDTWPAWHYPGHVLHVELWRDVDAARRSPPFNRVAATRAAASAVAAAREDKALEVFKRYVDSLRGEEG